MIERNGFVERRKHQRYKVKTGALVAVSKTASAYIRIGQLMNICQGGLSFSYISNNGGSEQPLRLDVLFRKDIVYMNFVRRVVVDSIWLSHTTTELTPGQLITETRGVKFKELSPQQRAGLDAFIQKYAIP